MQNLRAETTLDETDLAILRMLQRDGRITNGELSDRVHLSPSACHRRVQRLEKAGVIRDYVALLDPPTDVLKEAIARRARAMVADGLLAEVARVRTSGRSRTAAAAIGVAEAEAVLDGRTAEADLAEVITARTLRYARRQRAWFRADPRCVEADPTALLSRWAAA